MLCPNCGKPTSDSVKFCEECGQPLAPARQQDAPTQDLSAADDRRLGAHARQTPLSDAPQVAASTQQMPSAGASQFDASTQQMPPADAQQPNGTQDFRQYSAPAPQRQGGTYRSGGRSGKMGAHGRPPEGGKKKTGLIIGIIVAAVVVIGAAVAVWWFMGQQGSSSSSSAESAESIASATSESSQSGSSTADSAASTAASSAAAASAASASASASAASAASASAEASSPASSASADAQPPATTAFEGRWKLVRLEREDGNVTTEEQLAELEAAGNVFIMAFEADGRAVLTAGENDANPLEGTWVATSDAEGTAFFSNYEDEMQIIDGQLLIVEDGTKMLFGRIQ